MVAAGAGALMPASDSNASKGNDAADSRLEPQNALPSSNNQGKRVVKVEKRNSVRNSMVHRTAPIRETKASRLRAASIVSPTEGTPSTRKSNSGENLSSWSSQSGASSLKKLKSPTSSSSRGSVVSSARERDKTTKRASVSIKLPEAEEEKRQELVGYYERARMRRTLGKRASSCGKMDARLADSHENVGVVAPRAEETREQRVTGVSTNFRVESAACSSSSGVQTRATTQRLSSSGEHKNSEVLRRVDALTALTRATMERVERLTSHSSPIPMDKCGEESSGSRSGPDSTSGSIEERSSDPRRQPNLSETREATNSDASSTSTINSMTNDDQDDDEEERNDENKDDSSEIGAVACREKIRQEKPISILKHSQQKNLPGEEKDKSSTCGPSNYSNYSSQSSNSAALQIIDQLKKQHGILKKRSSLDDNEILHARRSFSPENGNTTSPETNGLDFKPILRQYERRSSLDELIKRTRSPECSQQHPTSILKRKSLGDEDREDGQNSSNEPTSILKRTSSMKKTTGNSTGHHASIAAAVVKSLGCASEINSTNGSEVRPILKKKFSREESSSSDPPSLEPRPILKKKSSTDSDEHDERPKTILKSSRKSSQEDSGNEIVDGASPKKLSMLKNRAIQRRTNSLPECDAVRPILKQSSSRESSSPSRSSISGHSSPGDAFSAAATIDRCFLRKRARSVGHVQTVLNGGRDDWPVLANTCQNKICPQPRDLSSLLKIHRNHESQNFIESRSNESDTSATATTNTDIIVTTATTTTTATSSVAPIVSFKLPSRREMENRYGMDDDYCAPENEGTKPEFRYNFGKSSEEEEEEEEDDDGNVNQRSRQNFGRRRDRWNPRNVASDSRLEISEKSRYVVTSSSSTNIGNSGENSTEISEDEKSGETPLKFEIGSKVSQLAQRFKVFEARSKENRSDRRGGNGSKFAGDRKVASRSDRFSTQPVTYEEVREAVLQNQRINSSSDDRVEKSKKIVETIGNCGDIEPSKLSIADRVKLFNRRIATESSDGAAVAVERSRRRPANSRYKTQPITSEEVEVASRIFPSKIQREKDVKYEEEEAPEVEILSEDEKTKLPIARLPKVANTGPPRSILKCSTSHTANDNRSLKARDYSEETNTNGIINEKFLLSSELQLTRKEFTARRMQRRRRNNDFSMVSEQISADSTVSANNNDRDESLIDNRMVTHESQTFSEHFSSIKKSTEQRGTIIETSCCITDNDNISTIRKDRGAEGVDQNDFPSISIADRLAALQRSGTTDWKRRVNVESVTVTMGIGKNVGNDVMGETSNQAEKEDLASRQRKLAERLEKLESAAEGWRKRVAVPDAVKFSVAGKMKVEQIDNSDQLSPLIEVAANIANDGKKKFPRPERFRSQKSVKEDGPTGIGGEEVARDRGESSGTVSEDSEDESKLSHPPVSILSVPRADDETFTSFFSNVSLAKCEAENLDFPESDFDAVTSFSELLVSRRMVKPQRRRLPSTNPLRTLAARTDIKDEYMEFTTGVAERVMKSLNVEKLAKNSTLAVEALAGLASTEDFGAVTLKNVDTDATGYGNKLPPYKDLMLILVKGRRHVQIRLIEPVAESINAGDNFILVTKNELYNYVGKYSNVIERARGAEIALSIQQNRDLGCRASHVITVSAEKPTCTVAELTNFWKLLGVVSYQSMKVIDAGHPDEDELYESALMDTNMVYEVVGEDELVPLDKYWGAMPKIDMLDPTKILVFDFGSEMYIWNGKVASAEAKKVAIHLAEELWREGYDYSECTVSPISSASIIGRRATLQKNLKKASSRPNWCLIGKLNQHMETVLFREKFLDWPNVSGVIRVKRGPEKEQTDGKIVVEPPNVDSMIDSKRSAVDFILEGSHLGRGTGWYDHEMMRQFVVATTDVTVWHIDEFSYSLLSGSSIGQFYTGDSYIIRWMYTVTITGRGLGGEPSKHASKGRDRCAYFIWQGKKASLNEQGTAALLTVELDQEQGPQIRVPEGFEPAAFLNLFHGGMVVHNGKKTKNQTSKRWRMYVCRGSEKSETTLTEVPCSTRQLRSRGSLLLLDTKSGKINVWHGRAAPPHLRENALSAANLLKRNRPEEAGLSSHTNITICEVNEGDKTPRALSEALGGMNKQLYVPLQENSGPSHTPRLFNFSSVSGEFTCTEVLCLHRSDLATPFPFLQDELYQASQPALFLLDNKDELWLWQGWWPDSGSEDQTGSGAVRWQAERRAAMITAMQYWQNFHPEREECAVYLVWAGLEPLKFTNLFPTWNYRDDIAELNIRDGRISGEVLTVEGELARLTQSTYPIAQLLQRPLPDGVDPTILEKYLSPQHFQELLGMNVEAFEQLPAWKQINVKKRIGLF